MAKLPLFPTWGRTFKNAIQELYQGMGYSLITSFLWAFGAIPIGMVLAMLLNGLPQMLEAGAQSWDAGVLILLFSLIIALFNGLLTGPLTTAFYGLYQERKEGYPSLRTFFKYLSRTYWLSARVNLSFSLVMSILVFNIVLMLLSQGLLLKVAGAFSIYALLFLMLVSFYLQPLIYYKKSFKEVYQKAFLLVLDNFGVTLGFGIGLLLMLGLSMVLLFPFLLLFGAFYIYYIDHGFELICQKYEAADENRVMEE